MTVLDGVTAEHVTAHPYPHLVVENAVVQDLCERLIDEFPPLSLFTKGRPVGDNVKIYFPAWRAFSDDRVSDLWKQFLRRHLTHEFYSQLIHVFRTHLLLEYPDLEQEWGRNLESFRVGSAGSDNFSRCDVLLDALIGIHTPVSGAPRLERRPHIKVHNKFLEGFLYLRPDDDDAPGGDYEFFSIKPGAVPRFGKWAQTDRSCLQLERTVPYGKGVLVFVLNTSRSIQALTPRGHGERPFMYANFTVQTSRLLFDLNYGEFARAHRYLRSVYDRVIPA